MILLGNKGAILVTEQVVVKSEVGSHASLCEYANPPGQRVFRMVVAVRKPRKREVVRLTLGVVQAVTKMGMRNHEGEVRIDDRATQERDAGGVGHHKCWAVEHADARSAAANNPG